MRFVCDCCNDHGRLVYVADLGQIMLAKLTQGREDGNGLRTNRD